MDRGKEVKTDMVQQYYKDPDTGMEMRFTKTEEWGWSVYFPKANVDEALDYNGYIPWPELSPEEQKVLDNNYKRLHEMIGREEDN